MPAILSARATIDTDAVPDNSSGSMRNLLITLVVLVSFCIILGGALYVVRRLRNSRKQAATLPSYDSVTRSNSNNRGSRLTIQTNRDSTFVYSEKHGLINGSSPVAMSPDNVPEIRITFPDEDDKDGRRISGRVVVVQVGEAGVGFVRPLVESDGPPSYQQRPAEQFDTVDIEKIGGLKEIR